MVGLVNDVIVGLCVGSVDVGSGVGCIVGLFVSAVIQSSMT